MKNALREGERHFMALDDLTKHEIETLLARAVELKQQRARGRLSVLEGRTIALVFEKHSTRTRVSFEVGVQELGGHSLYLSSQTSQLSRGEPIQDSARVLGRYCHGIVFRTAAQERADGMAEWSGVPVINALTDESHPCQVAADLLTAMELRPNYQQLTYAWIGDGNNMAHSWIRAAAVLGLRLRIACPEGFDPDEKIVAKAEEQFSKSGGSLELSRDPAEAIRDADVVSTDVWASMGQEEEAEARQRAFAGYCIDDELIQYAHPEVVVLHCLPAHRGEEISESVLEGPNAHVWQQAENRLHVQKAILELCFGKTPR